eukprot:4653160-Pyramimonas_sp.AAC.1
MWPALPSLFYFLGLHLCWGRSVTTLSALKFDAGLSSGSPSQSCGSSSSAGSRLLRQTKCALPVPLQRS